MSRITFLALALALSVPALAFTPPSVSEFPWGEVERRIDEDHQPINEVFKGRKDWKAWPCQGSYQHASRIVAIKEKFAIELKDEGSLEADATLKNAGYYSNGIYRSPLSFCGHAKVWTGVRAGQVDVKAKVIFGNAEDLSDLKVQVTHLAFKDLDIGIPSPLIQGFMTRLVNSGFAHVWHTWLGRKLNEKITQIVKELLAQEEQGAIIGSYGSYQSDARITVR